MSELKSQATKISFRGYDASWMKKLRHRIEKLLDRMKKLVDRSEKGCWIDREIGGSDRERLLDRSRNW
jgi:hypothetical protein